MRRRKFLRLSGGVTTLPLMALSEKLVLKNLRKKKLLFRTEVCDILNIKYPILQAGMANVAGPELAAAVSNAGGLGIMTATMVPPEVVRENIRKLRSLTDQPFGVNILLQQDLFPPREFDVNLETASEIQYTLNQFRKELNIPPSLAIPTKVPPLIQKAFEVILEERVPVWSIGLGNPTREMVSMCHERGMKVVAMVSTLEDALELNKSGIDIIIAQGSEAGGHRSTWIKKPTSDHADIGTLSLVPQLASALDIPVVAAGGIVNGRGIVAALAAGAKGVLVGTRFIASLESAAGDYYKEKILAGSSDHTTITDVFTGMWARVIRNRFTEEYRSSKAPVFPPGRQYSATIDITRAAVEQKNAEFDSLYAGQGIGQIQDIKPAEQIIRDLVEEAVSLLNERDKAVQI